jgi:CO/xanthine dehydrogenase FAD-binding subunit
MVTAKGPDEAVVALHWPIAASGQHHAFRELAMRAGDYAVVAAACQATVSADGKVTELLLGFGGCGDGPQVVDARDFLGHPINEESIAGIAEESRRQVECKDDLHARGAYRKQLIGVFAEEMLRQISQAKRTDK